jgi:DNA primase
MQDPITALMESEGLTFPEAVERLARAGGLRMKAPRDRSPRAREVSRLTEADLRIVEVQRKAIDERRQRLEADLRAIEVAAFGHASRIMDFEIDPI